MVVVIGGTGRVGSHLLFELAQMENQIIATYQTGSKIAKVKKVFEYYDSANFSALFTKISWKKVSVNDIVSLEEIISEGDEVYHCAALVSFHRKDFNPLMKINREGTTNVVNVCLEKKIRKLCYVSSTAAVSAGSDKKVSEETKWKKGPETSGYSISKNGAEREIWRGINEGLDAVMVNPCVILGAGNWSESSLTILGTIQNGLTFYPPGGNALVDARDVAKVMQKLMKSNVSENRFLLIGENISFQNLFTQIANRIGKKPPKRAVGSSGLNLARMIFGFTYLFSKKRSPITYETVNSALSTVVYSNEKCKKELGYEFHSLEETIDNALKGRVK
jgi:dihydroflavonol-4-reductase